MFRVTVILALVACAFAGTLRSLVPMPDGRIVGGENADITSYPYQVSVRIFGSHSCGGSILDERTIVTAAHCIIFKSPSLFSIQYGVTTVGGSVNVITASQVIVHNQYNSDTIDFDVAIIKLSAPIVLGSNARPIRLSAKAPYASTPAIVTGWGTTSENGASSKTLQQVAVNIVSTSVCANQYLSVNEITDRMLCAGVDGGGKDACQGDSGGPLVSNGELVGIVSWGVGCARQDYAGVYTNVATVLDWILANAA